MVLKIKLYLYIFYLSSYLYKRLKKKIFILPLIIINKLFGELLLSMEIPIGVDIGKGLVIYHGFGIVINPKVKIGNYCVLRQGVTIGEKSLKDQRCPTIGDYVEIGAGAVIIGNVTIGNNAIIGANAVVVNDVYAKAIVVGNPARVIGYVE